MREQMQSVLGWVKSHPVATAVLVALFAPGIVFGFVLDVLGFIGWGRIFLALLVLGGWAAYKFAKSELASYRQTANDAISLAREVKDDWYR